MLIACEQPPNLLVGGRSNPKHRSEDPALGNEARGGSGGLWAHLAQLLKGCTGFSQPLNVQGSLGPDQAV